MLSRDIIGTTGYGAAFAKCSLWIGERYRLNHAIVVKFYHSYYTQFLRNVRLSHQRIATFSAHRDFFIIAPYCTYLLRKFYFY